MISIFYHFNFVNSHTRHIYLKFKISKRFLANNILIFFFVTMLEVKIYKYDNQLMKLFIV